MGAVSARTLMIVHVGGVLRTWGHKRFIYFFPVNIKAQCKLRPAHAFGAHVCVCVCVCVCGCVCGDDAKQQKKGVKYTPLPLQDLEF